MHDEADSELKAAGGCLKALGVFALVCLVLYVLSFIAFPSGTLLYRIVVTVEADGEAYTGSSVMEVSYAHLPRTLPEAHTMRTDFRGEAVAVDIGDRGTLFVLLTGARCCPDEPFSAEHGYGEPEWLPNEIFDLQVGRNRDLGRLRSLDKEANVPFNRLPMMVRFGDINDPTTVRQVNPYDLEASFGEGVSLSSVRLETTWAWLSTGIDERLPWFHRSHPPGTRLKAIIYGDAQMPASTPRGIVFSRFKKPSNRRAIR